MKNKSCFNLLFLISFLFVSEAAYSVELKDPKLRDENISASTVSVEYFTRPDGLTEYVYSIISPANNVGIVDDLLIDLYCAVKFDPIILPYANGKPGYEGDLSNDTALSTPVAIHADYGSASPYLITKNGDALWGLYMPPGNNRAGMRLISAAKPGMRTYTITPYMDNDETWDYPEAADPTNPWIPDFTITGMIIGPGCPGVTEPPEKALYSGTDYRVEPENINALLSYRTPQKDRFHVPAGTKETTLHIVYDKDIDAKTFKVEPAWMKRYFNPVAGTEEIVTLPLKKERNKIKLSVHTTKEKNGSTRKNNEAHHSFKDTDVFEIRIDK